MTDSDERIRAALEGEKPQPGELHDAAIRRAMRETAAQLAGAPPARARRNYIPMGLAAGLLIVLAGATFMRLSVQGHRDTADVTRGGAQQSGSLEPAAGAELSAAPHLFRWPAQAGATAYTVTVRDGAGTLIWRSAPVTAPSADTPATLAIQISPGRTYLWSVTVAGQADVNELGPYSFHLR